MSIRCQGFALLLCGVAALVGCDSSSTRPVRPVRAATATASSASGVQEAMVECLSPTTTVRTADVDAGTRGVRVHVSGEGVGKGLYLTYGSPRGYEGGEPVPADGVVTVVLAPGPAKLGCQWPGDRESPSQPLVVHDPDRLHRDHPLESKLACAHPAQASSVVAGRGATAEAAADAFALIVRGQRGDRGSGYPEQNPQEFLLVRGGSAVGTVQASREGADWAAAWNLVCH